MQHRYAQEPAQKLEESTGVTADAWESQPWFREVWFHENNNTDPACPGAATAVKSVDEITIEKSAAYRYKMARKGPMSAARRLAYYLELLCNCIAHDEGHLNLSKSPRTIASILASAPVARPYTGKQSGYILVAIMQSQQQQQQQMHHIVCRDAG
jgi:hypothetical protein